MSRAAYLAPALVLLVAVIALPMAAVLPGGVPRIGEAFTDPVFRASARTTLLFASISVVLELALGLTFALLLHQTFRLRGLARALALVPWALPTAVMAMSWKWIFDPSRGIANHILGTDVAWLGRPWTAFAAIVVADVWKTTPFAMLILLAGLQSIPRDLYEAMAVDGAGPVRRFFKVTLPMLRPAFALALTFRLIQALGVFDLVYVMTGGGPADATRTLALYVYETTFRYDDPQYGAAMTAISAVGAFAIALGAGAVVRGRRA
jgi:trehalose/maltose transport system permease protein